MPDAMVRSARPQATIDAGLRIRSARAIVVVTGLLAMCGGVVAVIALVSGPGGATSVRTAPAGAAWSASASFGPVVVERLERLPGGDRGGGHGHGSTSEQVRVTLTLTNREARALPYSAGQFRLRVHAAGTTMAPAAVNPSPAVLEPRQTLHQRLTFAVPARRTTVGLVFEDLGRARPVEIDLGPLPRRIKE